MEGASLPKASVLAIMPLRLRLKARDFGGKTLGFDLDTGMGCWQTGAVIIHCSCIEAPTRQHPAAEGG
jgi:hypothetical protein